MRTKVINVYKEPCDICIMRPSILGNQFVIGRDGTREEVVAKHKAELDKRSRSIEWYDLKYIEAVLNLKGKKIGCCCAPLSCHGDNYVEFLEG